MADPLAASASSSPRASLRRTYLLLTLALLASALSGLPASEAPRFSRGGRAGPSRPCSRSLSRRSRWSCVLRARRITSRISGDSSRRVRLSMIELSRILPLVVVAVARISLATLMRSIISGVYSSLGGRPRRFWTGESWLERARLVALPGTLPTLLALVWLCRAACETRVRRLVMTRRPAALGRKSASLGSSRSRGCSSSSTSASDESPLWSDSITASAPRASPSSSSSGAPIIGSSACVYGPACAAEWICGGCGADGAETALYECAAYAP